MARPVKQGLDYYPLNVHFFHDIKISAIQGEFGIKGEITVIKLLCAIYENGYFIQWSEIVKFGLLRELPSISEELLCQIVNRLVKWGFFDQNLFDSAKVLTSKGIQKRFFEVYKNRVRKRQVDKNELEYWLLDESDSGDVSARRNPAETELFHAETGIADEADSKKPVLIDNSRVMARRNPLPSELCHAETPQSKVKESKVNNTKVVGGIGNTTRTRESKELAPPPPDGLFATTNKKSKLPPLQNSNTNIQKNKQVYEYWREGEYSFTQEFLDLLDAIGAKFRLCDGRVFATQLEMLLKAYQQAGVQDGIGIIRNALARLDTAEFIKSGRFNVTADRFLTKDFIAKIMAGSYDKVYPTDNNNKKHWKDAGVSFENMTY